MLKNVFGEGNGDIVNVIVTNSRRVASEEDGGEGGAAEEGGAVDGGDAVGDGEEFVGLSFSPVSIQRLGL